ncbi:adenosylmethionine decarboxylase [Jannaschia sp. Os4]|uniref:adenosylmethionine decarboxylase n=1 Tax=Jannaschia sp. Os4 TaxID=2807617 RepID=UPI00193A463F|nr:adenosylmethionine decarboxylase [Jannaschia sp. Os4]MBM2577788.1 adenosylmethionine decarboxylase [Jannaschia sp. Os4]
MSAMVMGRHLLLEHAGGRGLTDAALLERAMRAAAAAGGATVLSAHLHPFPGGGVTGVLLLAESHVTVHTWPEHGYAAFDLFLCGAAEVERAADALDAMLAPERSVRRVVERAVPALPAPV